jgi:prevent-host-death family protein
MKGVIMNIRPVSDLRNHYSAIENQVNSTGPVFLTKNGYGSMVIMNIDQYQTLSGDVEFALDIADEQAVNTSLRLTHSEVFDSLRLGLKNE